MRWALFYHSILSDWNHGNAHFLRGVAAELVARGHRVTVHEPRDAWSVENLVRERGEAALAAAQRLVPGVEVHRYDPTALDVAAAVDGADVVLVHEWTPPALVARIGAARARGRFRLLFHDTHHRAVSAPEEMARYDLREYDGALVFGEALRVLYLERGLAARAFTWHEAADVRLFRPRDGEAERDLVWVGNWGDGERSAELRELLIEPAAALGLRGTVHGVRYPDDALAALARAGLEHRGWLPNAAVPEVFARHRVTVHVPRRWYVERLPGIPTIRPFEALACGIPLVSGPWDDVEGLFRPGVDYLVARDGAEMRRALRAVLEDRALATELARNGLARIEAHHTCAHRVDALLDVLGALGQPALARDDAPPPGGPP